MRVLTTLAELAGMSGEHEEQARMEQMHQVSLEIGRRAADRIEEETIKQLLSDAGNSTPVANKI